MKVMMLARHFLPHIGGVEIHVSKVCKELAKRGYDITVVSTNSENTTVNEEVDGYHVIRDYDWAFHHSSGFHIVHCHDFSQYSGQLRGNVYMTFHGYEGHVPPDPQVVKIRQAIAKRVKGTLHVGNYLHKWYGSNSDNDDVIIGGVDTPLPHKHRRLKAPFKIAYIGRVAQDKRTDLYVAASHKIRCDFRVYEDLPNHKVAEIWAEQHVAFCNGQLSMLEAMAQGVPVVALGSNAMVRDMLKDFPMVMTPTCKEEIISMTKVLLTNENMYYSISKQSYDFACQNTWSKVADQYEKLWKGENKCQKI